MPSEAFDKDARDKLVDASSHIADLAHVDPDAPKRVREGDAFLKEKKIGEALRAYRRAVAASPAWPEARFNLAVLLGSTQMYEEAIDQMDWFLDLDPDNAAAEKGRALKAEWEAKGSPSDTSAKKLDVTGTNVDAWLGTFAYKTGVKLQMKGAPPESIADAGTLTIEKGTTEDLILTVGHCKITLKVTGRTTVESSPKDQVCTDTFKGGERHLTGTRIGTLSGNVIVFDGHGHVEGTNKGVPFEGTYTFEVTATKQ